MGVPAGAVAGNRSPSLGRAGPVGLPSAVGGGGEISSWPATPTRTAPKSSTASWRSRATAVRGELIDRDPTLVNRIETAREVQLWRDFDGSLEFEASASASVR